MKKILLVIIGIIILNALFISINVSAKEMYSRKVIEGTYQYSSDEGVNKQLTNTFIYKDDCFAKSSYSGCKDLEILSIQLASSSVSYYDPLNDLYDANPTETSNNVRNFLNDMEFSDITTNTYYIKEQKENSIGVIVGHKNIIQAGENYTLLAIIPRSAGYKQEWAGNMTVGDGDIHEGFKLARDEILRYVKKYINDNNITGSLKVWTTGWSRGAAVANMIGGFFAGGGIEYFGDSVSITPEDVYTYTIGTPRNIKNGVSKNTELSVSANRLDADYTYDTVGETYNYTKGGTVNINDSIYNGIRNIISDSDAFSLLPLESWGFSRYGTNISSTYGLTSTNDMLNELKSISEVVYDEYTENGTVKNIKRKTLNIKTLSLVDLDSSVNPKDFLQERLKGLEQLVGTNSDYKNNHYQDVLKSIAGIYGMLDILFKDGTATNNVDTNDAINALAYSFLAYASSELKHEGKADNETVAVTIALEELLEYFTGEEIEKDTFTIDEFIRVLGKFVSDNEESPVTDVIVSGIINAVPDDKKIYIDILKQFDKNYSPLYPTAVTREAGVKAVLKAAVYGADENCQNLDLYVNNPALVRSSIYAIASIGLSSTLPNMPSIDNNFEVAVGAILQTITTVKDDTTIIKVYNTIDELADDKILDLLDSFLATPLSNSEEKYRLEYKNDIEKHINLLKENISTARKVISAIAFYNEGGFSFEKIIENVATFVDGGMLIPINHYNEIYLAASRNSNRYEETPLPDEPVEEVESKKDDELTDKVEIYSYKSGENQTYTSGDDGTATFVVDADYSLFKVGGKVYVDEKLVDEKYYTSESGSTKIIFTKEFMDTLTTGDHTLKVVFNDGGVAETAFKVLSNQSTTNPKTSDNIINYVLLLEISIMLLIGVLIISKEELQ